MTRLRRGKAAEIPLSPADGGPADGGPADGGTADGGPADGGPADGGPADGGTRRAAEQPVRTRKKAGRPSAQNWLPAVARGLLEIAARSPGIRRLSSARRHSDCTRYRRD